MVAELSDGTPGVRGCKRCGKQITLRRKRPHQTFCSKECVSKWWAEQDWQRRQARLAREQERAS